MSLLGTAIAPGTKPVCVACKRSENPLVVLETRRLENGTVAILCVNPTECRRHWVD